MKLLLLLCFICGLLAKRRRRTRIIYVVSPVDSRETAPIPSAPEVTVVLQQQPAQQSAHVNPAPQVKESVPPNFNTTTPKQPNDSAQAPQSEFENDIDSNSGQNTANNRTDTPFIPEQETVSEDKNSPETNGSESASQEPANSNASSSAGSAAWIAFLIIGAVILLVTAGVIIKKRYPRFRKTWNGWD